MQKKEGNVTYTEKKNNIDGSIMHQWIEKILPESDKYKSIQKLEKEIKIPNRYIPLSQTINRSAYPEKEMYLTRKLKQTQKITKNIRQEIESIDNEFTINVRNRIKPEKEKVNLDIIKMNKIIQRRYIKERLEKIIIEEKKEKEDLIYKSEVSDLNLNINNIPSNNINENNKLIESNEKNKEDVNSKEDKRNRYMNL